MDKNIEIPLKAAWSAAVGLLAIAISFSFWVGISYHTLQVTAKEVKTLTEEVAQISDDVITQTITLEMHIENYKENVRTSRKPH